MPPAMPRLIAEASGINSKITNITGRPAPNEDLLVTFLKDPKVNPIIWRIDTDLGSRSCVYLGYYQPKFLPQFGILFFVETVWLSGDGSAVGDRYKNKYHAVHLRDMSVGAECATTNLDSIKFAKEREWYHGVPDNYRTPGDSDTEDRLLLYTCARVCRAQLHNEQVSWAECRAEFFAGRDRDNAAAWGIEDLPYDGDGDDGVGQDNRRTKHPRNPMPEHGMIKPEHDSVPNGPKKTPASRAEDPHGPHNARTRASQGPATPPNRGAQLNQPGNSPSVSDANNRTPVANGPPAEAPLVYQAPIFNFAPHEENEELLAAAEQMNNWLHEAPELPQHCTPPPALYGYPIEALAPIEQGEGNAPGAEAYINAHYYAQLAQDPHYYAYDNGPVQPLPILEGDPDHPRELDWLADLPIAYVAPDAADLVALNEYQMSVLFMAMHQLHPEDPIYADLAAEYPAVLRWGPVDIAPFYPWRDGPLPHPAPQPRRAWFAADELDENYDAPLDLGLDAEHVVPQQQIIPPRAPSPTPKREFKRSQSPSPPPPPPSPTPSARTVNRRHAQTERARRDQMKQMNPLAKTTKNDKVTKSYKTPKTEVHNLAVKAQTTAVEDPRGASINLMRENERVQRWMEEIPAATASVEEMEDEQYGGMSTGQGLWNPRN